MTSTMHKTAAIITCYNSKINEVEALISSLIGTAELIIVDNSTSNVLKSQLEKLAQINSAWFVNPGANRGIGFAQNAGCEKAMEIGCEYVIFFDDDSLPNNNIIEAYNLSYHTLKKDKQILILVPEILNAHNSSFSFSSTTSPPISTSEFLMNSGMFISLKDYENIGPFNEFLFVDYVDYEFGWRAVRLGAHIFKIPSAQLLHKIGEGDIDFLFLKIRIPSPIRHFYQFRNLIYLAKKNGTPLFWVLGRVIWLLFKLLPLTLIYSDRKDRLKFSILGFLAGIKSLTS